MQCLSTSYFANILPNVYGLRNASLFASPHSIVVMVIICEQSDVILKRAGLLP